MKQKKVIKIKTKFSNRLLYTFITLVMGLIIVGGVYAWPVSNAGHNSNEIDFSSGISVPKSDETTYVNPGCSSWSGCTSSYVFTSPHYYASAPNGDMYLGETGNAIKIRGSLIVDGSVTSGSFLYSPSDERLKTNIQSLQNSLTKVQQLKGVSFNWKANGQESLGLIAQDVEKVFPQIVGTDKEGMKSVDYTKLVAVLIEAMKEQQKQIDELKSRCN